MKFLSPPKKRGGKKTVWSVGTNLMVLGSNIWADKERQMICIFQMPSPRLSANKLKRRGGGVVVGCVGRWVIINEQGGRGVVIF